jgi:diguanylate cyclase (GGDEF)-like protein
VPSSSWRGKACLSTDRLARRPGADRITKAVHAATPFPFYPSRAACRRGRAWHGIVAPQRVIGLAEDSGMIRAGGAPVRRSRLARALLGTEPKLRRMLLYWAATAMLYSVCIALILLQQRAGLGAPGAAIGLCWYGGAGTLFFYALVRGSLVLGIPPNMLATLQGLFGISCAMWVYLISGPLRAATLGGPLVVITFCTFSLRPRQTALLAAIAIAGLGAAMWWLQAIDPARYPPAVEALTFGYLSAALVSIAVLTGEMSKLRSRLKRQKDELMTALTTIRTLATIDELTSLANRRYMNEVLAAEERRGRTGRPACVALLDIDYFKQVNDRHGHAAGDAVLRSFAGAARAELRASDVLARWGGEEFLLMLPNTEPAEAARVLQRIGARVAAIAVPGFELARPVSFSGGLAARGDGESFDEAIGRADRALYQAKSSGRDRVVMA